MPPVANIEPSAPTEIPLSWKISLPLPPSKLSAPPATVRLLALSVSSTELPTTVTSLDIA